MGRQFGLDRPQQPDLSGDLGGQVLKGTAGWSPYSSRRPPRRRATLGPFFAPADGRRPLAIRRVSSRPAATRARVREVFQHGQVGFAEFPVSGVIGISCRTRSLIRTLCSLPARVSRSHARTRRSGAAASGQVVEALQPAGVSQRQSGQRLRVDPVRLGVPRKNLRKSAPSLRTPGKRHGRGGRRTPRSASAPALGSNTTASLVPSGAPSSAACSTNVSDFTVGTHDARHTTWPFASSTRTECRDAIPRSVPTRRRDPAARPAAPPATSQRHRRTISPGAQQAAINGHGPRVGEPGNGSHSCAATGPGPVQPSTSLMRVIRGQASSGNQIREARQTRPQDLRVATYRTSRDAHATLEPLR